MSNAPECVDSVQTFGCCYYYFYYTTTKIFIECKILSVETHTHTRTHIHPLPQICMYAHTKHICMCTNMHMHSHACTQTQKRPLITTKYATKRLARNPVIKFNECFKNMSRSCTIKRTERSLKLVNSGLIHACAYVHTLSVTVLHQRKFSRSLRTD